MTINSGQEKALLDASPAPNDPIVTKILRTIAGTPKEIYSPSDDSFLMLDALSKIPVKGEEVLDIGTGSGILALFCALRGGHVMATDIDEKILHHAQRAAQSLGVTLRVALSDLFENIPEQFDLIMFNPPYLPSTSTEDVTIDGGKQGKALAERFLEGLGAHLKKDGTALLLLSSASDPDSLAETYSNFAFSTATSRALFFEELRVLLLRFREDAAR